MFVALLLVDLLVNGAQVSFAMLRPAYSFHNAATNIRDIVRQEPAHSQVVIADNAHEIALSSGLRPVNLLFHSASITEQMRRYQPGWWIQLAPIDDGRCFREVLSKAYSAQNRGEWQIFYPGQRLVLWKLERLPGTSLPDTLSAKETAACAPPVYN